VTERTTDRQTDKTLLSSPLLACSALYMSTALRTYQHVLIPLLRAMLPFPSSIALTDTLLRPAETTSARTRAHGNPAPVLRAPLSLPPHASSLINYRGCLFVVIVAGYCKLNIERKKNTSTYLYTTLPLSGCVYCFAR
jgi:hypothetical protein